MAPLRRMLVEDPTYRWILQSTIFYYDKYHNSVEFNLPKTSGPLRLYCLPGVDLCYRCCHSKLEFSTFTPLFTSKSKTVCTGFCNIFFLLELPAHWNYYLSEIFACRWGVYVSPLELPFWSFLRRSRFLPYENVHLEALWATVPQRTFRFYRLVSARIGL